MSASSILYYAKSLKYFHHKIMSAVSYTHLDVYKRQAVNKPTLADVYSQEFADFMEVFERVAIPEELQYTFFIEGGTMGVENAMKACFDWKTRKNFEKGLETEGDICIHFRQSFHGRSGYTSVSYTHLDVYKRQLLSLGTTQIKFYVQKNQ